MIELLRPIRERNSRSRLPVLAVGVALWLCLALPLARAEKVAQLKPQGYVNDFAGVLDSAARQQITALATELDQKAHAQLAVVTIHSLEGESVEDFANDLFTRWGIGPKSDNRGVLVLLAVDDHRYRVEVGYGLEPILPDGKVGSFGREVVPLFRRGDYSGGLEQLTWRIAEVIAQDRGVTLSAQPVSASAGRDDSASRGVPGLGFLLLVLFFLLWGGVWPLILLFLRGGGPRRRGPGWWMMGGGWGGGGWGGGGFGSGGGFGGFGGGMSGGGGASGSW